MSDNVKTLNERIAEFARSIANEAGVDPAAVVAQVSAAIQQTTPAPTAPAPAEPPRPGDAAPATVAEALPEIDWGAAGGEIIAPTPGEMVAGLRADVANDATIAPILHSDEMDPREANHLAGVMKRVLEAEWAEITGPLNKLIGEVNAAIAVASDPRAPLSQREKALGNAQGLSEQIGEVWMRIEREGHATRLLTTFDESITIPTPKIAAIRESLQALVAPPPEMTRLHRRLDDLTHEMRPAREVERRVEREAPAVDYSPGLSM